MKSLSILSLAIGKTKLISNHSWFLRMRENRSFHSENKEAEKRPNKLKLHIIRTPEIIIIDCSSHCWETHALASLATLPSVK